MPLLLWAGVRLQNEEPGYVLDKYNTSTGRNPVQTKSVVLQMWSLQQLIQPCSIPHLVLAR
ncbi:hypothetical protein HanIR_Chr17g0848511 [Helianthus annuus]|nr:hypothetical protein HanIR_Chr17g0848511 [Helianthus annuus]